MANNLEYAKVFQSALDEQMAAGATSGWMELNASLVKYNGGNEVKIPKIVMDGLGDYDRVTGFAEGGVTLSWETHPMRMDRGRTFSIDAMDVDETGFAAAAGAVMGEFQRTKVIPEVDAYRYSTIASLAQAAEGIEAYTPDASTVLSKLLGHIAALQDLIGEDEPLVISMSFAAASLLDQASDIARYMDVADFAQGNAALRVKTINGIPVVRVPSARFKTAYVYSDGVTDGQTAGGFAPHADAVDINWLITAKKSVIAVSKTDKPRIFDPSVNQKADAWKIDYRKYHDIWIPDNKAAGIFACVQDEA